jgi:hypothetical protein
MQPDPVMELFDEWAASLARGEQPDPQAYLERARGGADELARLMEAFLEAAPRPEPSEEAVVAMRAWLEGDSPLVALRTRRGLRRDDVVGAVMGEFALADRKRPVVRRYVHELEAGLLDPRRLSEPLAALLARLLEVPAATIRAARVPRLEAEPAFRAAAARAAPTPRPPQPDDPEVRSLFLSDR